MGLPNKHLGYYYTPDVFDSPYVSCVYTTLNVYFLIYECSVSH